MERERIEKEQAEKQENQLFKDKKEAVCRLPEEDDSGPAEEGDQGEEDEKREREESIK